MLERRKATLYMKKMAERIGTIENEKYEIVAPGSSKEIIEEGIKLHHCVAGYMPLLAERQTLILFLRKKGRSDVPFRTLEWNHGNFIQCQGKNNKEKTNGEP